MVIYQIQHDTSNTTCRRSDHQQPPGMSPSSALSLDRRITTLLEEISGWDEFDTLSAVHKHLHLACHVVSQKYGACNLQA